MIQLSNQQILHFCQSHGITVEEFENHPQKDDVKLLLLIRRNQLIKNNSKQLIIFDAIWRRVYSENRALNSAQLYTLERMIK